MPDYKRKKVKKSSARKKEHIDNNDIVMQPKKKKSSNVVPQNQIKLIRGSKYKQKKVTGFLLTFAAIICAIFVLFSVILPVGIYENVVNITALIGHGKYPLDVPGGTVLNCVSNNSYFYILTDTSITAYSNGGKTVMTDMHGFDNPIMSVSDTRVLVYDQGGKFAYIYNLGGKIHTYEAENEIITANISREGTFAVSTHSDNYTSVVNVYDKDLKHLFTWNCAKDIINNVLVNPAGNRLAVTTLNAVSGQYDSKMYILGFDSADPLFTLDLEGSLGLSLINTGKGVSLVCNDKYKFVHWSKFTTTEVTESGEVNLVRNSKNGLLLVFNRANNRSDNTVVLISNSGKKSKEFNINSIITDIQYSKGRVYYISDTNVEILDGDGNLLRNCNCSYGTERFSVVASNSIATVNDNEIIKIDIQKGEN